ncbi:KpsF/GutQ family sugar-phosphate isomerase [Amorphus orientalis]|uniref:Arabinose-5-phosphate isomerase n=1 Tax=Amorphus orientalis TaxID=649198 RepID=A0AAE3VSP3_9HYPH|nr:KpsF/GutQ family sugar-phosphate isomerase [Amorphus orientalis]MDQ0317253.1 arabinose-5-phosphate isomerase [Amorphus orientalis]
MTSPAKTTASHDAPRPDQPADAILSAARTLDTEIAGLASLKAAIGNGLGKGFRDAIATIQESRAKKGRVIVTGVGKSGHIGAKISATLASTGTHAHFVHAAEASHGDLGMIAEEDAVLALSWSGESKEFAQIVAYARRFRVPVIAMTSNRRSALGRAATVVLELPKATEACPHGLAPTTSTLLMLALGDALAVALLEARGFTAQDFKVFHPGGKLGARLQHVRDVMHTGDAVPLAPSGTRMTEAIVMMTGKGFGALGIVDDLGHLVGIITDGDLRRHLGPDLLEKRVDDVMSPGPRTAEPGELAGTVLERLNASAITALFVVEGSRPVGIVHLHDLLRTGVA